MGPQEEGARAADVARRQEATSLEWQAAMEPESAVAATGQVGATRELLAPIYGWFIEGFDTADLQEIKALLDELS